MLTIRRVGIWVAVGAVFIGIGWGMVKLSSNIVLPTTDGSLTVAVSESDNSMGPVGAPITLVEYGDFQCPACAAYHGVIVQLLKDPVAKDKVRLVFRNFPLTQIHANGQLSAQAATAAALQGKFWEMHDKLYENQSAWSGQTDTAARTTFESYATTLGLNMEQFKQDIDSAPVKQKIQADIESGTSANVQATPTFFVNGKKMAQPNSYDEFKQFVLAGENPQ